MKQLGKFRGGDCSATPWALYSFLFFNFRKFPSHFTLQVYSQPVSMHNLLDKYTRFMVK